MASHVFVTRPLPSAAAEVLSAAPLSVRANDEERTLTKEELIAAAHGADGLLCTLCDTVDRELLEATGVRAVANFAVGYDNIDVAAATELGVPVTNTPGVLTEATADLAWALLLAAARRVVEGDRVVRERKWQGWSPMLLLGAPVHGRTLGVIGLGRIGEAVARRARGFDMRVLYTGRSRKQALERELGASYCELDQLLAESDFVSIHVPLTEATTGLIDASALARMRPDAVLVNTARGEVIDEPALMSALRKGQIGAAALDVFRDEPDGGDPRWATVPRTVLTPHIGSATVEARQRMARMAADNLVAMMAGQRPPNLVNPEALGAP